MHGLVSDPEARLRGLEAIERIARRQLATLGAQIGQNAQDASMARISVGGSGTGSTGSVLIIVEGCQGVSVPDNTASVSMFSGATLIATEPAVGGVATFTSVPAGTYTFTGQGAAGAVGRWVPATIGPFVYGGSGTLTLGTVQLLTAATGFLCYGDNCPVPIPTTLSVSDSNGNHVGLLTFSSSPLQYAGCYTKTGASGANPVLHVGCTTATVTSPIGFVLASLGTAFPTLTLQAFVCDANNQPTQGNCSSSFNHTEGPALASLQCWPFVITYTGINFPSTGLAIGSLLTSGVDIVVSE